MASTAALPTLAAGEVNPVMARRGITIAVAVILLLLMYFGAALVFNRTNPDREVHLIPVRNTFPFPGYP